METHRNITLKSNQGFHPLSRRPLLTQLRTRLPQQEAPTVITLSSTITTCISILAVGARAHRTDLMTSQNRHRRRAVVSNVNQPLYSITSLTKSLTIPWKPTIWPNTRCSHSHITKEQEDKVVETPLKRTNSSLQCTNQSWERSDNRKFSVVPEKLCMLF